MIISFDIDNTLIPYSDEFLVESPRGWRRFIPGESLRQGTTELFHELDNLGHELWIYTTSFRSKSSLRRTFWRYGLRPKRIINETENIRILRKAHYSVSKHPRLFGIDVHVDDSEGVEVEGKRYGFEVIRVDPSDVDWREKIWSRMKE